MFLSRSAFDDAPPADASARPKTGGFSTVSRHAAGRPGTATAASPAADEGVGYGRHGAAGSDFFRPQTGPGADAAPAAAAADSFGSAGVLATPGESRTTALERQKQLYTKRRTEVVTGGMFTASRPIDGPAGAHATASSHFTPGIPQFSAPKSLGESLPRPGTAGSATFGSSRPVTSSSVDVTPVVTGRRPSSDKTNDERFRNDASPPAPTRSAGDLTEEVDGFVASPEARPTGRVITRTNRAPPKEEEPPRTRAPPAYDPPAAAEPASEKVERSARPATATRRTAVGGAGASAPEAATPAERELASRGLASTFDPNPAAPTEALSPTRVRTGGMGPAAVDLTDIMAFIHAPTPKAVGVVQCYIERDKTGLGKKMYPVYQLYLKEGDRFLLAGKKRPKQKTSNYLISRSAEDLSRDSDSFVGKLRSNFVGTEFTVFDDGVSPEDARKTPDRPIRAELACCTYASNVFGSRGPRKMRVYVPRVFPDNSRAEFRPLADKDGLLQMVARNETVNIVSLINKPPKWNEQVGAYVLNFNGRVTMASVKNFQLVTSDDHDSVVLQFGRVGKDLFTMDYQWPLSPLQAFAICLSSFDYKLACE